MKMKRSRDETSLTMVESVSKLCRPEIAKARESSPSTTSYVCPIVASYNHRMRPLLDTVDRLRSLQISIQLPTIVVVGAQSSGKSGVLGSLTGICLPTGRGSYTRVPLIMKLKNHTNPVPELSIEFNGKIISTNEENVANDIIKSTEEIAGKGNWISDTPLTLTVKKKGVPSLTMVDLPGIILVPQPGQPEDIYERISDIILEYITPDESIIVNVVPAFINLWTSESTRITKQVDKTGQRTLTVVTKADRSPEELLENIIADDLNIGLGYVCVRNRIRDETQEKAREEEAKLFESDKFLSKIDKSMVGIPVLAERLMDIQYAMIVKCLPEILRKIDDKLRELNSMPKLNSVAEAFLDCVKCAIQSLNKILFGEQFVTDLLKSHGDEMLLSFTKSDSNFMEDELIVMEQSRPNTLPNFGVTKQSFHCLLEKKVDEISAKPFERVEKIWHQVEEKVISVLVQHCGNYPQLIPGTRRVAQDLIAKKKQKSRDWVKHIIEMEKSMLYCCGSEYVESYNKLMLEKEDFINTVHGNSQRVIEMEKQTDYTCNPNYKTSWSNLISERVEFISQVHGNYEFASIRKFGVVNIVHLWKYNVKLLELAYDLKMKMTSYWDIVTRRMIDNMILHLNVTIQNLVKEMDLVIIDEFRDQKSKNLHCNIKLLKESRKIVADALDDLD